MCLIWLVVDLYKRMKFYTLLYMKVSTYTLFYKFYKTIRQDNSPHVKYFFMKVLIRNIPEFIKEKDASLIYWQI